MPVPNFPQVFQKWTGNREIWIAFYDQMFDHTVFPWNFQLSCANITDLEQVYNYIKFFCLTRSWRFDFFHCWVFVFCMLFLMPCFMLDLQQPSPTRWCIYANFLYSVNVGHDRKIRHRNHAPAFCSPFFWTFRFVCN